MMKRIHTIGLLLTLMSMLMFGSPLMAAVYTLPDDIGANGTPFKDCSPPPPGLVFSCTKKVDIKGGDSVVLVSNITLNINNEFKISPGSSVDNSGFVFNVSATRVHIDGSGTVVMDNLTASGDIVIHKQANLTGNVTSTGGDILIEDGNATVNGNIDAENGDVTIEGGNNVVDGNITADNGNGTIDIDGTSTVSGTCNPDHPQCDGGPGGPGGPGAGMCTTEQIATDGEEFRGISGSSDSDIFAIGHDGSIYHYDGSSWSDPPVATGGSLHSIEVVAANLAYAVGHDGEVFEFDGTDWNTQLPAPTGEDLNDVWAISSTEVWVVGKKEALYRWDGNSWDDMSGNGAGQIDIDNNKDLVAAWGGASFFYTAEKDGDLYRYARPTGPGIKISQCNDDFDFEVKDIWGDDNGNIYLAGKTKRPDEAAVLIYNESTGNCDLDFSTNTEKSVSSISGNDGIVYAVGENGLVLDKDAGAWSENTEGGDDFKAVWVSPSNTPYYAGKNGMITTCTPVVGVLDHFVISPATFAASTCLANAITIRAEDSGNNTLADYIGTVTITTTNTSNSSIHRGNWSKQTALGVLNPDPDNDDNGSVLYTFDAADPGFVTLNLNNTHAETLTITVSDGGVSTTSADITFGDNVFVITVDPVQVAGRPLDTKIEMYTNDGANCFVDTNYNYSHNLNVSIDRNGVLPAANDPTIGVAIPDLPSSASIGFDFGSIPGEANFVLDNDDVGQYRLVVTDNTLAHSDLPIVGISEIMTLPPFGIGITLLRDTVSGTLNPGNATSADPIFTTAGNNLSATVSGVLWLASDDIVGDDGVLDTGVYSNNPPAPSFAWDTDLAVSLLATSYTPSPGTPGSLNNSSIAQSAFGSGTSAAGTADIIDLQYTEVGSFTLLALVEDYLAVPGLNIIGDDMIVGRFIPATFEVGIVDNGILDDACGIFTYVGQDFSYDTAPRITVTAMNSLGVRTAQYRDAFVKLDATSLTVQATRDESTVGTDSVLLDVSYGAAATTFTAQNNGIVNYTFGADTYRYGPNAPVGFSKNDNSQVIPFTADIDPAITEITDTEVTATPPGGTNVLNPVGNNLLFGRLRMENAHGTEISPLSMKVVTESWNGFSFQKNMLDTCTTIAAGDLISVAVPIGLSVPAVGNAPASAGDVNYSYPAPGNGNDGYIDTLTNLSTAAHLWLRYDWNVDGVFDDDPTARATFGIYEGDPVQIYLQQIYQ